MSMSTIVCRPSLTSFELSGLQRTTTRMHSSAGSLGIKGSAISGYALLEHPGWQQAVGATIWLLCLVCVLQFQRARNTETTRLRPGLLSISNVLSYRAAGMTGRVLMPAQLLR
jgi:hypothetical protein